MTDQMGDLGLKDSKTTGHPGVEADFIKVRRWRHDLYFSNFLKCLVTCPYFYERFDVFYSFVRQLFSFEMFDRKLAESAKNYSLSHAPCLTAVLLCCGLVKNFALRSYEMGK